VKTSYLCHITEKNGKYSQQIIEGILELKSFLRSKRIHFQNAELSYLKNRAVRYKSPYGITYEIEVLADNNARVVDNTRYITINSYCEKYDYCRQTVYTAINTGRIRVIRLGYTQFVQDVPIAPQRKNHIGEKTR